MYKAVNFMEGEALRDILPGGKIITYYKDTPVVYYDDISYFWIDNFFIMVDPFTNGGVVIPWTIENQKPTSFKHDEIRGACLPTINEWKTFYKHFGQIYPLEWLAGGSAVLASCPLAFLTTYNTKIHGCCKGVARGCLRVH